MFTTEIVQNVELPGVKFINLMCNSELHNLPVHLHKSIYVRVHMATLKTALMIRLLEKWKL